jgi:hypothetical protein
MRLLLGRGLVFLALATPVVLFCGCRLGGVQFGTRVLVHAAAVDAVGLAQSTVMAPTSLRGDGGARLAGPVPGRSDGRRLADITSSRAITVAVCIAVPLCSSSFSGAAKCQRLEVLMNGSVLMTEWSSASVRRLRSIA